MSARNPARSQGPRHGSPTRLRPLNEPRAVRVGTDEHGTPVRLTRGRRTYHVAAERERWRIQDEWWRRPISRSYHSVVLENGQLTTLFQDLTTGTWFLQD